MESRLNKMTVESQGCGYCLVLHHDKGNAIRKGVRFVRPLLKKLPAPVKEGFGYMNQCYAGTLQEHLAKLHGLLMSAPTVEEGYDLVENKGRL